MTINNYYRHYLLQLQHIYSLQEASVITEWVFDKLVQVSRLDIIKAPESIMNTEKIKILDEALGKLLQHYPVQYLLGETIFYNLKLKVNNAVLIPRPETEELVDWIINDLKKTAPDKKYSMLEIGSGSGCISIALQKNLPDTTITAIDISEAALAVAIENSKINNASIDFLLVDFLDESEWMKLPKVDIIVSNPPYIPVAEKNMLDKNVTHFEPHTALFVPDKSPLLFYEKIANFAKSNLKKSGIIYVETHEDFAAATAAVFSTIFKDVILKKDLLGKNRMVKATDFR